MTTAGETVSAGPSRARATRRQDDGTPCVPADWEGVSLDFDTFSKLADLIYSKAGIRLGPTKVALVNARVGKRMRKLGMTDFRKYWKCLSSDRTGNELVELLNAITTNVTHFFRESRHFDFLAGLVRQWSEENRQLTYRIWCAACSTGEEPYSIAMTMNETLPDAWNVKILATDLSTRVLDVARRGEYSREQLSHMPRGLVPKYFVKNGNGDETRWVVKEELKRMLTFARLNLSVMPYSLRGSLDVIFCRNTMIYFDNPVRKRVLNEFFRLIRPGGYLFVGHAESLSGMLSNFDYVEPSIYVRS